MFKEVGNFVIEDSGNSQLYLSDESIVWPNNLTAPSSEIAKCKSCDQNCYNGETTKRELFVMISYVLPKYPFTVNSQKLANLTTDLGQCCRRSFVCCYICFSYLFFLCCYCYYYIRLRPKQ